MDRLHVLVVDDEAVIREAARRILEGEGYGVSTASAGGPALELLQRQHFDIVVTDLKMPGMTGIELLKAIKILQPDVPVIIITGYSTVETAVDAIKNGAFDYIAKPFSPETLLEKLQRSLEHRGILLEEPLRKDLSEHHGFDCFTGQSPEILKVYRRILQVAPTDSTVLITGESGTGKELAARAIHANSRRKENAFVAVDCNALAENLLESELFGHVKGSFTGAVQTKTGLFKVADGGTLFLDEVANMSMSIQGKLLRALQERKVTPIGGTQPIPVDIRLIVASNRDLRTMVKKGEFREDLFFRLNIIPLDLPPLRERKGDIPLLAAKFLKQFAAGTGKGIRGIAPDAMAALEMHGYPGNVRELENLIERAVVLAQGDMIRCEDLEIGCLDPSALQAVVPLNAEELKETKRHIRERAVEPVEKAFTISALRRNNWNITRAAEETGMLRPNFQALMKKLGISAREGG